MRAEADGRRRILTVAPPLALVAFLALRADRSLGVTAFAVAGEARLGAVLARQTFPSLLADTLTVLMVVGVLLVARAVGRPRSRGALFVVLVLGSIVALQFGAAVIRSATGAALETDLQLARAFLLAGTVLAALSVLESLAEHRATTGSLLQATARAESLAESGRAALERLRDEVAAQVREVLRDALETLGATAGATTAERAAGEGSGTRLRALADEVLRPLSHRLASAPVAGAELPPPVERPGWRRTLLSVGTTPVIPPRTLAVMAAGLAFLRTLVTDQGAVREVAPALGPDRVQDGVGLTLTVDWVSLLTSLGELGLILVLAWWGGARFAEILDRDRDVLSPAVAWTATVLGLAAIATLTLAGPALFGAIRGTAAEELGIVPFLASFVPLAAVTVGVSLVAAVQRDRAQLEHALEWQSAVATRAAARMQAVVGHEQQRLARALHADVQAAVNAASLVLDRADREGAVTPELVDDVAARIAVSVERFLRGSASRQPLLERLDEVRALWDGVCRMRTEVAGDAETRIDADTVARELIVDLVAEACANAVVHGGAQEVRVAVTLGPDDEIELRVEDDGVGHGGVGHDGAAHDGAASATSSGGLGSAVLRASCTRFALERSPQGATLTASVPLG